MRLFLPYLLKVWVPSPRSINLSLYKQYHPYFFFHCPIPLHVWNPAAWHITFHHSKQYIYMCWWRNLTMYCLCTQHSGLWKPEHDRFINCFLWSKLICLKSALWDCFIIAVWKLLSWLPPPHPWHEPHPLTSVLPAEKHWRVFHLLLSTSCWVQKVGGGCWGEFFSPVVSCPCSAPTGWHPGKINGSAVHHDTQVQILKCSYVSLILRNLAHLLSLLSANQARLLQTWHTHRVSIDNLWTQLPGPVPGFSLGRSLESF